MAAIKQIIKLVIGITKFAEAKFPKTHILEWAVRV